MQIAFLSVFPEHLATTDRRGDSIAFLAAILLWNWKYPAFKDRPPDGDILQFHRLNSEWILFQYSKISDFSGSYTAELVLLLPRISSLDGNGA